MNDRDELTQIVKGLIFIGLISAVLFGFSHCIDSLQAGIGGNYLFG